jgi:hypothetical protein
MFLGFLWTTWIVREEADGVKVCGALTIVSAGLLLPIVGILVFHLLSPRQRAGREALETYQSFQAAVRRDDFETAWGTMCSGYRQTTPLSRFEERDAELLAAATAPTATMSSTNRVVVDPGLWSGGAQVTLIHTDDGWCLLEVTDWSYD